MKKEFLLEILPENNYGLEVAEEYLNGLDDENFYNCYAKLVPVKEIHYNNGMNNICHNYFVRDIENSTGKCLKKEFESFIVIDDFIHRYVSSKRKTAIIKAELLSNFRFYQMRMPPNLFRLLHMNYTYDSNYLMFGFKTDNIRLKHMTMLQVRIWSDTYENTQFLFMLINDLMIDMLKLCLLKDDVFYKGEKSKNINKFNALLKKFKQAVRFKLKASHTSLS